MAMLPPQARVLLKSVFGYDDFRPGQAEIIAAVLAGGPVLAVMPTGSGKSMCYQLPAIIEGALTVVVSPLIALMRDQVQQMRALGVAAATLNSMNGAEENDDARRAHARRRIAAALCLARAPAMDGLIADAAPRRARDASPSTRPIAFRNGAMISVPNIARSVAPPKRSATSRSIGLTATADAATRDDIAGRLFPSPPQLFLHSFDRPNIALNFAPKDQPRRQLSRFLDKHQGRKRHRLLLVAQAHRRRSPHYFAGAGLRRARLSRRDGSGDAQSQSGPFPAEDGVIAVATIAFGMGVNKPDVRFVAHADMPSSRREPIIRRSAARAATGCRPIR